MLTYLVIKRDVANSKEISEQLNIPQKKGKQIMVDTAVNDLYYTIQSMIEEKLKLTTLADLITATADSI